MRLYKEYKTNCLPSYYKMAKKQNIKTMADRILSGNRFNIPPLTEMEKKELKERTLLTILQLKEL